MSLLSLLSAQGKRQIATPLLSSSTRRLSDCCSAYDPRKHHPRALPPYAPELNPIENFWNICAGNKLAITASSTTTTTSLIKPARLELLRTRIPKRIAMQSPPEHGKQSVIRPLVLLCGRTRSTGGRMIILDYAEPCFARSPTLRHRWPTEPQTRWELGNVISLEVLRRLSASFVGPRITPSSPTCCLLVLGHGPMQPRMSRILNAVEPGLATTVGPLILASPRPTSAPRTAASCCGRC